MSPPTEPADAGSEHSPHEVPRVPWVALGVGGAMMGFAIVGAFVELDEDFWGWGTWVIGADLAHDAIVAPLACAIGVVVARLAPHGRVRAHVQAGLVASAAVVAVAWIPLRGWGGNPGNPTIRPLDYGSATLSALALVWIVVGVSLAAATIRSRALRA